MDQAKKEKKKNKRAVLLAAAGIFSAAAIVAAVLLMNRGGGESEYTNRQTGDLAIPKSGITQTPSFYPYKAADGTKMEVLAVKAPDGTIRTAFNTCQVCYASGRGYYKTDGATLVCQNCGNQFTADQVEVQHGGCNPVPISSGNKTENADSIVIPKDFLSQASTIFQSWKR